MCLQQAQGRAALLCALHKFCCYCLLHLTLCLKAPYVPYMAPALSCTKQQQRQQQQKQKSIAGAVRELRGIEVNMPRNDDANSATAGRECPLHAAALGQGAPMDAPRAEPTPKPHITRVAQSLLILTPITNSAAYTLCGLVIRCCQQCLRAACSVS
jgi:hypothetical protein